MQSVIEQAASVVIETNWRTDCVDHSARADSIWDQHHKAMQTLFNTPSHSVADLRAKAQALVDELVEKFGEGGPVKDHDEHDKLAWSLANDVLALL